MNTLERALIEKTGREHGFENIIRSHETEVVLASARHRAAARIKPGSDGSSRAWRVDISGRLIQKELARTFPHLDHNDNGFFVEGNDAFAVLLRRAAELAQSLPDQAFQTYTERVQKELPPLLNRTDVERITRQRVGQATFREALMDYWRGSCAVTGIALPEILRASHAKPWAECGTDEERLDVFNGFLLCANLDALFDRGLITFDPNGTLVCSPCISPEQRSLLHLTHNQKLRWVSAAHEPYLAWHRTSVFKRCL